MFYATSISCIGSKNCAPSGGAHCILGFVLYRGPKQGLYFEDLPYPEVSKYINNIGYASCCKRLCALAAAHEL